MITQANGKVDKSIRTFATTTAALLALADWLASLQVSYVAMESTGVLWRPIYNVLEDQFELTAPVSFLLSPYGCCGI